MTKMAFTKRCPGCGCVQSYSCRDALVRARRRNSMCVPCSNRAAVPDVEDRFLNKVMPEPNTGCWLWAASGNRYGHFRYKGRTGRAHRVAYVLFVGDIPDGMNVLHKCDTPMCVNPRHLWLGTQADNVDDMMDKGRARKARGERAGPAKLTADQVREIKERLQYESCAEIASDFDVIPGTIGHIATGHTWSHIGA